MARKSFAELESSILSSLPDNDVGFITPAMVRTLLNDILDAIRPAYGWITQTANRVQTVGLTPVKMLWSAQSDSSAGETVSSFTSGEVARQEKGTSTVVFTTDFVCDNGRFVTFALYKNGAATQWRVSGTGAGAGNPVAVSLSAIDYADPPAVYSIYITAEINGVSATMSSAELLVQLEAVNTFN